MIRQLLLTFWHRLEYLIEPFLEDWYTFGYPPLEVRQMSDEDYQKYMKAMRRLSCGNETSVTVELSTGPMTIYTSGYHDKPTTN